MTKNDEMQSIMTRISAVRDFTGKHLHEISPQDLNVSLPDNLKHLDYLDFPWMEQKKWEFVKRQIKQVEHVLLTDTSKYFTDDQGKRVRLCRGQILITKGFKEKLKEKTTKRFGG